MNKNNIKAQMVVKDQVINVIRIDDKEFISLTDLARYADEDDPRYPIQNWMRNKCKWNEHGVSTEKEYAILINEIYKEWSGLTAKEYEERIIKR